MNNIKFRCWCYETKRLFNVDEISWYGNDNCINMIEGTEVKAPNRFANPKYNATVRGNELYELLMDTGMKDIHGKEIYEGDIVRYRTQEGSRSTDSSYAEWISIVNYSNGSFHPRYMEETCDDPYYNFKMYHLEIIGNKFEHPELLNK